jgi:hypothetical protein
MLRRHRCWVIIDLIRLEVFIVPSCFPLVHPTPPPQPKPLVDFKEVRGQKSQLGKEELEREK